MFDLNSETARFQQAFFSIGTSMSPHAYTREEMSTWSNEELHNYAQMRFVWMDSVTRTEREQFYALQTLAEEILAERQPQPSDKGGFN